MFISMQQVNYIPLHYSGDGYKYKQIVYIPDDEICAISSCQIKELFEEHISKGSPHLLALVHDEARGQNVYDANALGMYLAKNERWKWLNPQTKKNIRKIDYFVINSLKDGYRLVKEIDTQTITGETYEDFWLCNNLAGACDPNNPYSFQSMIAMGLHYNREKHRLREKEAKHMCFKSIEKHYGLGIALLLIPSIVNCELFFLEKLLFDVFNYTFLDTFFENSLLETFIKQEGMEFFNTEQKEENNKLYCDKLDAVINEKSADPACAFIKFMSERLTQNSLKHDDFYPFLKHANRDIVSLTQAFLCVCDNPNQAFYIQDLRKKYPDWSLGRVLELKNKILSAQQPDLESIALLSSLSSISNNLLLLESVVTVFEKYSISTSEWKNKANIRMRMICVSRFHNDDVKIFAHSIEDEEPDNSLSLLAANFALTDSFSAFLELSRQQIKIGLKNKNKTLYDTGIDNGLKIFRSFDRHKLFSVVLGKALIAEITPYRASKEMEATGVKVLEQALLHPHAKILLAEYYIRKGTRQQALEAHEWLKEIKDKFPQDPFLPYCFIRYALRFAKDEKDLDNVETELKELEKRNDKLPLFYLLRALWYSHPFQLKNPEWFVLASADLKKAFEDADSVDCDFLIKNLRFFDRLTDEEQTKCRVDILCLLGLGFPCCE